MFPVFQECRPLAIGIHKAVSERIPGINPQQLRLAMRMHTASARYLKALTNGETRFDLDGNAAGAVTLSLVEAEAGRKQGFVEVESSH